MSKQANGPDQGITVNSALTSGGGLAAVEAIIDRMSAILSLADPDPFKPIAGHSPCPSSGGNPDFYSRCRTQQTIEKNETGILFALQRDNVRKFYISCGTGECRVDFYHDKSEFDRGLAAFA